MTEKEDNQSGIKINDRRRFTPEGEAKEAGANSEPPPETRDSTAAKSPSTAENPPPSSEPPPPSTQQTLPADLSYLIFSLATSVQTALGIIPHPNSQKPEKNLLQAQHAIDLLEMLAQKTQGNLTREESELLEAVLYQLRLQFVEAKKEAP